MPYTKRVQHAVLYYVKDAEDTLEMTDAEIEDNLAEYRKVFEGLDKNDYNQRQSVIDYLASLVGLTIVAKSRGSKSAEELNELAAFFKEQDIDEETFNTLYKEAFDKKVSSDKYQEEAQEELAEEQKQREIEAARVKEEEQRKAEQSEAAKEEEPLQVEQSEPAKEEELPELIRLDNGKEAEEKIEEPEKANVEAPAVKFEEAPKTVNKKENRTNSQRNIILDIFENSKIFGDSFEKDNDGESFAAYLNRLNRDIKSNATISRDEINGLIKKGEESSNIFVLGSTKDNGKAEFQSLKPDLPNEKEYNEAMKEIKDNEFSQKMGLLYAGMARKESRRIWDYINPFKWGPMLAENKAIKELRNSIMSEHGINEKQMETYGELYQLRDRGLPKNFYGIRKNGEIEVRTPSDIPVTSGAKGFVNNVLEERFGDLCHPTFEKNEPIEDGQEIVNQEQLFAQITEDVKTEAETEISQPVQGKDDPSVKRDDPKIGEV